MKKLIVLVVVLLSVSVVAYGATGHWEDDSDGIATYMTTGNVGIGTPNPGKKLEVNGDIKIPINKRIFFRNASIQGYSDYYDGLKFYTGPTNISRMTITPAGQIGIGTTDPHNRMEVYDGVLAINEPNGNPEIRLLENGTPQYTFQYKPADGYFTISEYGVSDHFVIKDGGNVGIGTTEPGEKLVVAGNILIKKTYKLIGERADGNDIDLIGMNASVLEIGEPTSMPDEVRVYTPTDPGQGFNVLQLDGTTSALWVENDGSVGIGTTQPQTELAVNGTITTKEVIVTQDGWPDFVFSDNHKLMPLNKLEKHIKVNKSLPGIPTEKEALKNGVKVGDMQAKLLEKVEELTLYVIELKKENIELKKTNEELKNRISALER